MASVACYAVVQQVIADNADGAFIPASAFTYMRYVTSCRRLWRCNPAEFERYEKFVTCKIDDKFGLAAAEQQLETTASTLIRGECVDFVGLEELELENDNR